MTFSDLIADAISFIQAHQAFALPIAFGLAFCESLAFISLLVPATFILIGVGALVGETGLSLMLLVTGAAAGASCGDAVSYWLGSYFKGNIAHVWPLSRDPGLLMRGRAFFKRWGGFGIFIGRFTGPLRAFVPLSAGVSDMPLLPFLVANVTSACVWAFVVLAPGALGIPWIKHWLF